MISPQAEQWHGTSKQATHTPGSSLSDRKPSDQAWASLTPADLIGAVFSKWPSVLIVAMLVGAIVVGILVVWPDRYFSDGMIYVRLGRAALSVDPTAQNAGSAGVSIQATRSAEVSSVAEMLNSREIAERVVEQLGVNRVNQPHTWLDRAALQLGNWMPASSSDAAIGGSLTGQQYADQIDREQAVKRVRQWLSVSVPKEGHTVGVIANGPDPLLVRDLTQAVMEHYRNYHVEANRSDGSMEFFEQQVAESKAAAVESRERLQRARSESGWMSLASAESTLRDRIVSLEAALDAAESDYAETVQRAKALKGQLVITDEWVPTEITKGVANVASDSMRTQLFGEQVQESEQLATIKPTHPRYRLLQEKMTRNAEIATGENADRELTREALNPIWQQLESQLSLASAGAEGLKSKCQSLRESLQKARADLLRLNDDAVLLSRLKWQADLAEEALMEHARSLEEARIIFELDRKKMSDVTIVQDASLNLKKVGPPRAMLAGVGALLGLAVGAFQALLRFTPPASISRRHAEQPAGPERNGRDAGGVQEQLEDPDSQPPVSRFVDGVAVPSTVSKPSLPR